MRTTVKTLYDADFVEWTGRTAELLRARKLDEVDLEHVAEEIEDLRDCAGWRRSIVNSQERIAVRLQDSRKRIAGHLYARGARRDVRNRRDLGGASGPMSLYGGPVARGVRPRVARAD